MYLNLVWIIPLGITFYLFLISPRLFDKPDRRAFLGVYYAHRGLHDNNSDAPENSLEAIRKAVLAGYGIEFDVRLTKDEVPVVFHDMTLKRMCEVDRKVCEFTYQELQKYTLAKSKEKIPTFEKVLETVDGKVPLIIEYKMDTADTRVCEVGDAILQKYKGAYCVESFHPMAVKWYKKNRPQIMRGQLSENYAKHGKKKFGFRILTYLLTNVVTRPDFVAYNWKDANNLSRCISRKMGALAVTYTIKSQEDYEKAKKDFDLFIFDSFILK